MPMEDEAGDAADIMKEDVSLVESSSESVSANSSLVTSKSLDNEGEDRL